jgi:hypothetical protein
MVYHFEGKIRVLVLDERVYKGKLRLYVCASENFGLIRLVGKGLYLFGVFEVFVKRSRTLYYLEEAKPIYDYRHILRNPSVLEAYSKMYEKIKHLEEIEDEKFYPNMIGILERLQREPNGFSKRILQTLQNAEDLEDMFRVLEGT